MSNPQSATPDQTPTPDRQEQDKAAAAKAALDAILPTLKPGAVLGIGAGSTVHHFIRLLAEHKRDAALAGAVAASTETAKRLKAHDIPVLDLNAVQLTTYVDGADEVDPNLCLIKGGGGALTLEKITAEAAEDFICIADQSKSVTTLGAFPLPIEVIGPARQLVTRQLERMGGSVEARQDFVTDCGHGILTVSGLDFSDPVALESALNDIPGVVCCGIFAHRRPNALYIGGADGVTCLTL